jgi:transposase
LVGLLEGLVDGPGDAALEGTDGLAGGVVLGTAPPIVALAWAGKAQLGDRDEVAPGQWTPWSSPTSVESRCWIPCCPTDRSAAWEGGYPPEFRRKVLDLVEAGRPIAEVAKALGISDQSIYAWRRQDRIDRGLEPGLTSGEKSELGAAKRRIVELETELKAMRRAMELVREVVPPKGDSRRSR